MLNVALPKGRLGDKVYRLFKAAGYDCAAMEQDDRRLVLTDEKCEMSYLLVKPSDVAIYVEHGAADVGVVGKDVLLEDEATYTNCWTWALANAAWRRPLPWASGRTASGRCA